ncbi:G-protein coupled receptor moody [Armadillidium vulgare]|nr:G-protein coupled receptor moody [Armadillidium vulgare]
MYIAGNNEFYQGNLLTIVALPHVKKLRNAATWFIVNLAVIEMCFCVTVLPMSAAQMLHLQATNERLFDAGGCKLFVFLRYVHINRYPEEISRYLHIEENLGLHRRNLDCINMVSLLEIYGAFDYNSNTHECDFDVRALQARKVFLAIGFFVPCLIIIISYSYIFYKLKARCGIAQSRIENCSNHRSHIPRFHHMLLTCFFRSLLFESVD